MTKANPKGSLSARSQGTISTYFTQSPSVQSRTKKRPVSPIDLTSGDKYSPAKKPKNASELTSLSNSESRCRSLEAPDSEAGPSCAQSSRQLPSADAAKQWAFTSFASPEQVSKKMVRAHTASDEAARQERRNAFKKKLLGENNSLFRRHSDVGSESEMQVEVIDVDQQEFGKDNSADKTGTSGDESDEAFKDLKEMFSNKQTVKGKLTARAKGKTKSSTVNSPKKKVEEIGPSGQSYTPLEKQVLKFKAQNPGTLLMIEVGYKYRFFGDDAKVAAKELGMVCFPDRNFLVASVPTFRREVYLKKLLSQGYRVGIVTQIETAALKKVSENRNALFDRKLTNLYTAATYVDGMESVDDLERYNPPPLMCLLEEQRGGMGADERVCISMIAICPSTGDVVWDEFDDSHMRTELETRMAHTKPAELLLPSTGLTEPTEKMLAHFAGISSTGDRIRTERFNQLMSYSDAFAFVSEFYTDKTKFAAASDSFNSGKLMAAVADFPKRVVVVLAHTIKHLISFSIADAFLETKFFTRFTSKVHMLLNGNTLANLEIYRNETEHTAKGSLMWILDRTKTKFGARMLRNWVGRPLIDMSALQDRVDAVEEIVSSSSELLVTLRDLLKNLPDLAKGLCRIQYGKCTPQELAVILSAFNKIANGFASVDNPSDIGFKSRLLNEIIFSFPKLKDPMKELLSIISLKKAAEGKKVTMWNDPERYPAIADIDMVIQTIEVELSDELKSIRRLLRIPALKWTTVLGEEYLIELKKSENHAVPETWYIASRTKNTERYYTPEVKKKVQEREQYQEALQAEAQKAYLHFLNEVAHKYYAVMRDAVDKLATADCLLSFALVALQENYVRPQFTEEDVLEIVDGRHPMVEALRSDPFVPNTVKMGGDEARSKIITGPNMGGKSSSVRMIALIAIMAQIGSYVPATSVRLGMQDCILTRMGASDDLMRGRSTFMVEMSETSDILQSATAKSLVILDELGRGTSTFDGMAIAHAVLDHLVSSTKCKTLFITHYPLVATALEKKYPTDVQNLHMGYQEEARIDGTRDITFLYRLTRGIAVESFGVECARLAGLPEKLLEVAAGRSGTLQSAVERRMKQNKIRKCVQLLHRCLTPTSLENVAALNELQAIIGTMASPDSSTGNI